MRAVEQLSFEPAPCWRILQQSSEGLFQDIEQQMRRNHQRFLETLMLCKRPRFLNAEPYLLHQSGTDQANGFYTRSRVTRAGLFPELRVPRTRPGHFQSQVLDRYSRRDALVNHLLRQVFLAGVSSRQTGATRAALLDESLSAATVSEVCKALDTEVAACHRRPLSDRYR